MDSISLVQYFDSSSSYLNVRITERGHPRTTFFENFRTRTGPGRPRTRTGTRTSIFENFSDKDGQDGDENVRGRKWSEILGTSEDEDGEDVDALRRPGLKFMFELP